MIYSTEIERNCPVSNGVDHSEEGNRNKASKYPNNQPHGRNSQNSGVMRKYIYIGCGSFIGAVLRYLVKSIQVKNDLQNIPINTLFVNILGAFAMAFILTVAFEVWSFDSDIRLGATTGLLGAFTTFSSLCKETVILLYCGNYFTAIVYMTVSVMIGLGAVYAGIAVARKIYSRRCGVKCKMKSVVKNESEVN